MNKIFILEVSPLTMDIEVFGIPRIFDKNFTHFSLAFPSTGGTSSLIFRQSSMMPAISHFEEPGKTLTPNFIPFSCFVILKLLFKLISLSFFIIYCLKIKFRIFLEFYKGSMRSRSAGFKENPALPVFRKPNSF